MVDINSVTPLNGFSVYSCAKAALAMLTKACALEMAPDVRCNAISPGIILWPSGVELAPSVQSHLVGQVPLRRQGATSDIAHAALYLATSPYITGQDIAVDGGLHVGRLTERPLANANIDANANTNADAAPLDPINESFITPLPILRTSDEQ